MNNPILSAFGRADIMSGLSTDEVHHVDILLDGLPVGVILPERPGHHEMAYTLGSVPIGPAFDPAQVKQRLIRVMFKGDAAAFQRASLKRRGERAQ